MVKPEAVRFIDMIEKMAAKYDGVKKVYGFFKDNAEQRKLFVINRLNLLLKKEFPIVLIVPLVTIIIPNGFIRLRKWKPTT